MKRTDENPGAIMFLKTAARAAGMPYARYLERYDILSDRKMAMADRHEVPSSGVSSVALDEQTSQRSMEAYADTVPGGVVVPSIISTGIVAFRKDMRKKPVGRPRKRRRNRDDDA